ncbi:hypothetical protein PC114_g7293 [Phytophthora cactorum]|nr:hypothetical protein PC114_g7293 [Phytophthora cactorum]
MYLVLTIRVSEPDLQHVAHWSEAVVSAVSLQMQIYIPVCKMISTDLIKEPAGIFMYVAPEIRGREQVQTALLRVRMPPGLPRAAKRITLL